jgi:uncharacterized protein (DUF362 family)
MEGEMSSAKVVVIKSKVVPTLAQELDQPKLSSMLERGLNLLSGTQDIKEAVSQIFSPTDRVGIKINTIGGRNISTRPELSLSLAALLVRSGLQEKNIIIWDRTNRELREAGYHLATNKAGLKVFGTDTEGVGYESELVSHLDIGSLFSTIQSNFITASISLAILKDHGLAGVTASLKNYFGAIHNPNKYHDSHCNPFIAELFDTQLIKGKHKLSILDGLRIQYHRGPSYHPQWAEDSGLLIFSRDAVAADSVGWQVIEKLRAQKGLPTLEEENRKPLYLFTAEKLGLGTAGLDRIQILENEV